MSKREIAEVCAQLGRRQVLKAFAGAVALTAYGGHSAAAGSAGASIPSSEPNELVISLPSGSQTNYPLQFGRAFAKGAVPGLPAVALDGVPLALQQVDVKTLHDDCSVKFAVISVVIPWLDTRARVLSITNKAVTPAPAAETLANMLAKYDFDARIGLAVGGRPLAGAPISARSMLSALTDVRLAAETAIPGGGVNSRYWTVGPVCTTVLLCDHTTKAYDVGTNTTKAIRPMFHVQFWPSLKRYHVRHILEVADVTKLKDETGLDVTFTTGQAAPAVRLSQTGVNLYLATFQTRAFWGGVEVPRANVNHGLAYLSSTKALPNWDPSIKLNALAVADYKKNWDARPKAIGDAGYWQKAMAATGGRWDLGLIPKWEMLALYSGEAHLHDITERNAEIAGSWRFFLREGAANKTIFGDVPGMGHVPSKLSRPTQWVGQGINGTVKTGVDGFTFDGPIANPNGWNEDSAHTPGVFWLSYLTTGQAIWHEKLMQMAAWSIFIPNPGIGYNSVATAPTRSSLILNGLQSRAWGWQYRNRARAWWAALDGSPEKDLFEKSLHDAAAQKAGLYNIAGMMEDDPIRKAWDANHAKWYETSTPKPRPNNLAYWEGKGGYTRDGAIANWGATPVDWGGGAQAPWMRNFIALCLYHAVELGYEPARPLADWSVLQTNAVASGPQPARIGQYIVPDVKADGSYYNSLAELYEGWDSPANQSRIPSVRDNSALGWPGAGAINTVGVTFETYGAIAAAAIAMSNGSPQQASAWAFVKPHHEGTRYYDHDPRYAIIPRT